MILALHLRADGTHEFFEYDPRDAGCLALLQEKVGGWLEVAPTADRNLAMYCHEEGKIRGLPPNVLATAFLEPGNPDVIMGDVVLVGPPDREGYDTSLPEALREVAEISDQRVKLGDG